MIETKNYRELSKKEKILGLTRTSWGISAIFAIATFPHIFLFSIFVFIGLFLIFSYLEFRDDDFMEIVLVFLKERIPNEFYC